MSYRPIIGITVECSFQPEDARSMGDMKLNWNYAQAIFEAGGNPVILPPMADMKSLAGVIDGWLIPGGLDIDAARFGDENHPKAELQDPARFESERALYDAISTEMPILGICYGCQFLNVVRGGDLVQHLPDVLEGDESHSGGTLAKAAIECGSKLQRIVKVDEVAGKSYHHQSVHHLGSGLAVSARHSDGTIEAIEAVDRPWVIGVQWHPERTFEDGPTRRLFAAFIGAARAYRESRLGAVRA